jgi:DNA polymerase-3 subunit delta'
VGHERAIELLARAVAAERLSHAYLLSGPRGTGKRTLAIELAKAMLCLASSDARPCQQCASCRRCESGTHPDLRVVQLDDEHVQISRKEIGELQRDAVLRPLIGSRKVYILVDADLLSDVAANQLLKLLEEPPPGVMLILTTAEIAAVLPTILSRLQHIRLQTATSAEIAAQLVSAHGLALDQAERIAACAAGRIGWALRAAADPDLVDDHDAAVGDLAELLAASRLTRLMKSQELAGRWSGDRDAVLETLARWASLLRDGAVSASCRETLAGDRRLDPRLAAVMTDIAPAELIAAARAAQQTCLLLEQNVHPRLALDTLLLDLPRGAKA